MCSSPTAPHGGITLATRVSGPQHHIVSNSYKLVRAPRPLRSHGPPHRRPTALRRQAPCPFHSYHEVPSAHKFRRAPLAVSQAMSCQLRSLRPPRSSHSLSSYRLQPLNCSSSAPEQCATPPLETATQTFPHSAASADATTQLSLTEFFLGCIYSKDPLDRSVPPPAHGNGSSASLPQPIHIATVCSPSSTSRTTDRHACTTAPRARLHSAPPRPPGLEDYAHLCSSHGIPAKAAPVGPCTHTSTSASSLQPRVSTTEVGTHADSSSTTFKRSASTVLAGTHHATDADPRAGRGPFSKPRPVVLPMARFGLSKPAGLGHIHSADSDPYASSMSSLYSTVESRSSAQEPHQDHCDGLWKVPYSNPTGSQ